MTKDGKGTSAPPNPIAPLFQVARTLLAEIDRHLEQFSEYGRAQAEEAVTLAAAVRAQSLAASRAALDSVEDLTAGVWHAAPWSNVGPGAAA